VSKYFTRRVEKSNKLRGKKRKTWFEEETINIGSYKQIIEALAGVGVTLPKVKPTAAETLEKIQKQHPAIPAIIKYKKAAGLNSKFGQKLIDMCTVDGIIHPDIFQIGSEDTLID